MSARRWGAAEPPLSLQASVSTVQLWVSGILAILRVLVSQSTEDIVLSRIQELSLSPYFVSCPVIGRLRDGDRSPTPEERSEGKQTKMLPEETLSRCVPCPQGAACAEGGPARLHCVPCPFPADGPCLADQVPAETESQELVQPFGFLLGPTARPPVLAGEAPAP